jgi:hypothetical protein
MAVGPHIPFILASLGILVKYFSEGTRHSTRNFVQNYGYYVKPRECTSRLQNYMHSNINSINDGGLASSFPIFVRLNWREKVNW